MATVAAKFELFFQPSDTGAQVGKTAFLTSASNTTKFALAESRTVDIEDYAIVADANFGYTYFKVPIAATNLVQSNFNQNGGQAALGWVTGVLEVGNSLFLARHGVGWYDGTNLQIRLYGARPIYKA